MFNTKVCEKFMEKKKKKKKKRIQVFMQFPRKQ